MQIELEQLELRYEATRIDDPSRRARLMTSLVEHGQQSAVLVVAGDGDGSYVLIDGYGRVAALAELGRDLVEATVLDLPEGEALIVAHRLEGVRRRSAVEEGWLIGELVERHGLSQREVATRLHRSVSWVSRRLGLVRSLPGSIEEALRAGVLPPHAAARFLVPLARANEEHCERLIANLAGERVSVRDVERLYRGWLRSDGATREQIVGAPALYLRAERVAHPDAPTLDGDPAAPLLRDLHMLTGVARRALRRVREGLLHELDVSRRGVVANAAAQARLATEAVTSALEGVVEP